MEPTNQKALYHKLMAAIDLTLSGALKPNQAREVSNLAARMNTAVKLEHDRVRVQVEIEDHAKNGGSKIDLRNIEGKNFEN